MAIPVRLQILALKKRLSAQAHIFCPMVEFSWKRRSTSTSKLLACRHHVMPPTICSGEDGGRVAIQPTDHVKSVTKFELWTIRTTRTTVVYRARPSHTRWEGGGGGGREMCSTWWGSGRESSSVRHVKFIHMHIQH